MPNKIHLPITKAPPCPSPPRQGKLLLSPTLAPWQSWDLPELRAVPISVTNSGEQLLQHPCRTSGHPRLPSSVWWCQHFSLPGIGLLLLFRHWSVLKCISCCFILFPWAENTGSEPWWRCLRGSTEGSGTTHLNSGQGSFGERVLPQAKAQIPTPVIKSASPGATLAEQGCARS